MSWCFRCGLKAVCYDPETGEVVPSGTFLRPYYCAVCVEKVTRGRVRATPELLRPANARVLVDEVVRLRAENDRFRRVLRGEDVELGSGSYSMYRTVGALALMKTGGDVLHPNIASRTSIEIEDVVKRVLCAVGDKLDLDLKKIGLPREEEAPIQDAVAAEEKQERLVDEEVGRSRIFPAEWLHTHEGGSSVGESSKMGRDVARYKCVHGCGATSRGVMTVIVDDEIDPKTGKTVKTTKSSRLDFEAPGWRRTPHVGTECPRCRRARVADDLRELQEVVQEVEDMDARYALRIVHRFLSDMVGE